MPWMKVDAALRDHRKVRRLARRLEVPAPTARGLILGLWLRVLTEEPDGELDGWDPEDIHDASGAEELLGLSADALATALVETGLLDETPRGYRVHDWAEWTTSHLEAERRRARRSAKRTMSATCPDHVRDASRTPSTPVRDAPRTSPGRQKEAPAHIETGILNDSEGGHGLSATCPDHVRDMSGPRPRHVRDVPRERRGEEKRGEERSERSREETPAAVGLGSNSPEPTAAPAGGAGSADAPAPFQLVAGAPPPETVISLPALPRGTWFHVTRAMAEQWQEAYPNADVELCLRRIRAKAVDEPQWASKPAHWPRKIRNWLGRERPTPGGRNAGRAVSPQTASNMAVAEAWLQKHRGGDG